MREIGVLGIFDAENDYSALVTFSNASYSSNAYFGRRADLKVFPS